MDDMTNTLLSGSSFKEFYAGLDFYKLTNSEEVEKSHKYNDGLNVVWFKENNHYIDGGMKFYEYDNILNGIRFSYDVKYIRKVEISDDASVLVEEKGYAADKLILKERILFTEAEMWNDIEFCKKAIEIDSKWIKNTKNLSIELKYSLIRKNPYVIEHLTDLTEEMCLIAVRYSAFLIKYIENPSENVCLEAISRSAYCFNY